MHRARSSRLVALAGLLLVVLGAPRALAIQPDSLLLDDPRILNSHGFLASHPDQRYRRLGLQAYEGGHLRQARDYYRMGARYADKLSQAAYAEMLWNGEGGSVDQPAAYAWMDLAAERGTTWLLAKREQYWKALSPAQQQQALQIGQTVYAEYRDAVARPRLERELRVALKGQTGSHLGASNNRLKICIGPGEPTPNSCRAVVSSDIYYHKRFWQPDAYWDWQDQLLASPDRQGQVQVGDPQALPPASGQ
ncbi:hypothetical protein ABB29_13295 [Pseudoxanthomonas dokdonensis]|uniref:Sel1 repeat-containing protein n=2 Tax=Pseudoxanthomonas dokdonensis TaxID=344882 RepID=A0A0R0CPZ1_9GAMM|nr:hypothetical protein ABB29_13295 [Pseudoxanthomonas dokdonensis]